VMSAFEKSKKEPGGCSDNGKQWQELAKNNSCIVDALTNCYHLLVVVWNGSDMKIPETLLPLYENTIPFILEALDSQLFPMEVAAAHPQHKVVKAILGTLHNFCNKHDNSISDLREKDALRIIGKYRNSGADTLKAKAMLAYSYLLSENNDEEKSVLELGEDDIKFLITVLKDALGQPNERSKLYGYNAEELIVGLNNIAVIDSNKQRLVDAGILPYYLDAMKKDNPPLQECAAHGVWTLAFDENSKQKISSEPHLLESKLYMY